MNPIKFPSELNREIARLEAAYQRMRDALEAVEFARMNRHLYYRDRWIERCPLCRSQKGRLGPTHELGCLIGIALERAGV